MNNMCGLREAVVGVQSSLVPTWGGSLHAVWWDHHEDEVRQVLFLPLVQVIQVQALVLLVHTLITDTAKVNCFFCSTKMSLAFAKLLTAKPVSLQFSSPKQGQNHKSLKEWKKMALFWHVCKAQMFTLSKRGSTLTVWVPEAALWTHL